MKKESYFYRDRQKLSGCSKAFFTYGLG